MMDKQIKTDMRRTLGVSVYESLRSCMTQLYSMHGTVWRRMVWWGTKANSSMEYRLGGYILLRSRKGTRGLMIVVRMPDLSG